VSSNLGGVNSIVPCTAAYRSPFLWHSTPSSLNPLGIVFVNQELLILSSTLLSLVDGLQEVSEDPLCHVPALLPGLFIREAEMDAMVDADIDCIPGQI